MNINKRWLFLMVCAISLIVGIAESIEENNQENLIESTQVGFDKNFDQAYVDMEYIQKLSNKTSSVEKNITQKIRALDFTNAADDQKINNLT